MTRVALVTGGGRGIGLGVSRVLLADGFSLAFCGMREEGRVASLPELTALGEVFYVQADVSKASDRKRLVETVVDRFGRIDILVNNAGVAPSERLDLLETTVESYDRVMNINLKGPYFLTQEVARVMVSQAPARFRGVSVATDADGDTAGGGIWSDRSSARGIIVFISSISATVPSVQRGEYCLSKAGLVMATKLWSTRLADDGVLVYEIRPGIIETDMTSAVKRKYDDLIDEGLLLQRRWGEPDDVGKAIVSIARGNLSYSTGQVIYVDGGLTRRVL